MIIDDIVKGWGENEQKDREECIKIQETEKSISKINKAKEERWNKFHNSYDLDSIDVAIENYLSEKGFMRIESIGFSKDVFGTYKRNLRKNPTYSSNKGYVFRINADHTDKTLRYEIYRVKNFTKNKIPGIQGITEMKSPAFVGEYVLAGLSLGGLPVAIAGADAIAILVGSGAFGMAGSLFHIMRHASREDGTSILAKGYESIAKLTEVDGKDSRKYGDSGK